MDSTADEIKAIFRRLEDGDFTVTSPSTMRYNCIAWAAGDDSRWWWPGTPYWPGERRVASSVDIFVKEFAALGYEPCESAAYDPDFNKVALYAADGQVTHAARQVSNGRWTSKLGRLWDIEHTLEGVCGPEPAYGEVVKILRRRKSQESA